MNDERETDGRRIDDESIVLDGLVRDALDRAPESSSSVAAVLARIGARTPHELNADFAARRLRTATLTAAGLLFVLVFAAHRGRAASFGAGDDDMVQSLFAVDSADAENGPNADRLVADLFPVELPE